MHADAKTAWGENFADPGAFLDGDKLVWRESQSPSIRKFSLPGQAVLT